MSERWNLSGDSSGIGVMGGTFDPIHIAHLLLAEEVRTKLRLNKILFVPAHIQWRKAHAPSVSPEHRLQMVRLGIASNPHFVSSTVDLDRKGPSYTVDTLEDLRAQYGPSVEFFFIVGMDALLDLPNWRQPGKVAQQCRIVALGRRGFALDWGPLEASIPEARERILALETPQLDISSTEIRRRVAAGESIRYWVPVAVEEYIYAHGLYGGG